MNDFRRKPRGFALFQTENNMFCPDHPHQTEKRDGRRPRRRITIASTTTYHSRPFPTSPVRSHEAPAAYPPASVLPRQSQPRPKPVTQCPALRLADGELSFIAQAVVGNVPDEVGDPLDLALVLLLLLLHEFVPQPATVPGAVPSVTARFQ